MWKMQNRKWIDGMGNKRQIRIDKRLLTFMSSIKNIISFTTLTSTKQCWGEYKYSLFIYELAFLYIWNRAAMNGMENPRPRYEEITNSNLVLFFVWKGMF